jgi:hypothetical protein
VQSCRRALICLPNILAACGRKVFLLEVCNMKKKIEYEIGSGNVFADLGFPDAEERLAKLDLAIKINELIKKRSLLK